MKIRIVTKSGEEIILIVPGIAKIETSLCEHDAEIEEDSHLLLVEKEAGGSSTVIAESEPLEETPQPAKQHSEPQLPSVVEAEESNPKPKEEDDIESLFEEETLRDFETIEHHGEELQSAYEEGASKKGSDKTEEVLASLINYRGE